MDTKELVGLGIAEGLAALEAGRTSSEEWTAALRERMERLEPRLNSLTYTLSMLNVPVKPEETCIGAWRMSDGALQPNWAILTLYNETVPLPLTKM